MIYFVSGHRNLTQAEFDNFYAPKIDSIVNGDNCASFVVGDWEGLDSMFIDYMSKFEDWEYGFITIYCVDKPRVEYQKLQNNVLHYADKIIFNSEYQKDYMMEGYNDKIKNR